MVLVGQIRSGRVTLSKDHDTINNAAISKVAADMHALHEKVYK